MSSMNPKVDVYLGNVKKWREEFGELRRVVLGCGLIEELKWGKPCYTFQAGNVVILQGFKDCVALLFAKGALLTDPEEILEKPGENTQAARRIPFAAVSEIVALEPVLKAYLQEAIEVERAGLEVSYKKTSEFVVAEEFQQKLEAMPGVKAAFEALTPGRQRAYLLYFAAARQAKTRELRIGKCLPRILAGRGLKEE